MLHICPMQSISFRLFDGSMAWIRFCLFLISGIQPSDKKIYVMTPAIKLFYL